jgi:hypothetical protein
MPEAPDVEFKVLEMQGGACEDALKVVGVAAT